MFVLLICEQKQTASLSLTGIPTLSVELIPLGVFIRFVHFIPEHEVQFKTAKREEELFFFDFAVSDWEMFCCHRHVKFCGPFPNETFIVVLLERN